jgi:hypothetical protein
VKSFIKNKVERRIDLVKRRSWMPQFSEDGTTINIMEEGVIVVGEVGESPIVREYIP